MSDFIMYSDGFFAEVFSNVPHPTNTSIRIFRIKPTDYLTKAKKLDINDTTRDKLDGTYEKEYNIDLLIPFDRGTYGSSYFALFDWDGKKSEKLIEEIAYKVLNIDKIEWLRKRSELKNLQNIQMFKDAREITSQPEPFRKQMEKDFIKMHTERTGEAEQEGREQGTGGQY